MMDNRKTEAEFFNSFPYNISYCDISSPEPYRHPAYERFFFTRGIINNKYHEFIMNFSEGRVLRKFKELYVDEIIDDHNFDKLLRRIEKWNNLQAPIPLSYIEFIGLNPLSITTAAKADMNYFKDAMKQKFYPECFYIRTKNGVIRISLPDDTDEQKAIEIATDYRVSEPALAKFICAKDLKTIVIEPDSSYYTLTYPPVLSFRRNMFIPGMMGGCNNGLEIP